MYTAPLYLNSSQKYKWDKNKLTTFFIFAGDKFNMGYANRFGHFLYILSHLKQVVTAPMQNARQ